MTDMTRISRLALALSGALLLAACGGGSHEGEAAGEAARRSSSAGLPEGRVAEGEQLAQTKGQATGQSCIDCHGPDGNEPLDPTYPRIGGQYADYLAHALRAYKLGERTNPIMAAQVATLSEQDILDLAAWFAAQDEGLNLLSTEAR